MSELFLVRHAQASFGQENYDQLSDVGHRQSQWLGEYFAGRELRFDRIVSGTLRRHVETAKGIIRGMGGRATGIEQYAEWDEYDFLQLLQLYRQQFPDRCTEFSSGREAIYRQLREALHAWAACKIECNGTGLEDWVDFQARVGRMLEGIRADRRRNVLVVSSGGALAIALQHVMDLTNTGTIQVNLQTRNTGLHHCYFNGKGMSLSSFNNIPHLENGARRQYITYA